MTPPSIWDIGRDDELLDTLGARRTAPQDDAVAQLLAGWTDEIDAPDEQPVRRPGRYARARRGGLRVGVAAAVAVAALSVSGVAAAMTDTHLPVFHQLGQITHGLVFGESPVQASPTTHPPAMQVAATTDAATDQAAGQTTAVLPSGTTTSTISMHVWPPLRAVQTTTSSPATTTTTSSSSPSSTVTSTATTTGPVSPTSTAGPTSPPSIIDPTRSAPVGMPPSRPTHTKTQSPHPPRPTTTPSPPTATTPPPSQSTPPPVTSG